MVFSPHELAILRALRLGITNKKIARDLDLCEAAVYAYRKSLCRKLGVDSQTEAALWAAENDVPKSLTHN